MRTFNSICCLLFTVAPLALHAQTITASITGTVSDPSGASIPSAKVTATNTGTNGFKKSQGFKKSGRSVQVRS
jgi:predicted cobalt transporter CbtA